MASTTLGRAASFSSGATASSRSRKVMSAGTVGALARNFSFEPGVERQERRGRSRDRPDRTKGKQPGPCALRGRSGDVGGRAGDGTAGGPGQHGRWAEVTANNA